MGAVEPLLAGGGEALVKYHSCVDLRLMVGRTGAAVVASQGVAIQRLQPATRQGQAGSLTGAVASQKVTEAPNGSLRVDAITPTRVQGHKGA